MKHFCEIKMKLRFLKLREMISEIVHDFLPLIFDFLSTECPQKWRALILDGFGAERILVVEISDLELSVRFH